MIFVCIVFLSEVQMLHINTVEKFLIKICEKSRILLKKQLKLHREILMHFTFIFYD